MKKVLFVSLCTVFSLAGLAALAADAPAPVVFNGKDFTGLKLFLPDASKDPAKTWSVKDGVIHCTGDPAGYFRTEQKQADYELTFQWRWPGDGGNSGVLLHIQDRDEVWPKSIEGQLHSGDAADIWVIGGTTFNEHKNKDDRRTPKMKPSTERPLGEWNDYRVVCNGDTIELYINGTLQNRATGCTVSSGYIGFQSEGTPIQFRNIQLTPLKKAE